MSCKGEGETDRDLFARRQHCFPREVKGRVSVNPGRAETRNVGARIIRVEHQHREAFIRQQKIAIEGGKRKMTRCVFRDYRLVKDAQ